MYEFHDSTGDTLKPSLDNTLPISFEYTSTSTGDSYSEEFQNELDDSFTSTEDEEWQQLYCYEMYGFWNKM